MLVQESFAPVEHLPLLLYGSQHEHAVWSEVARPGKEGEWGSGVYVKDHRPLPLDVPGYRGWVIGAELERTPFLNTPERRLRVFSVHAPTGQGQYAAVVNSILDQLARFRDGCDLVIGGDFNLTISPRRQSEQRTTSRPDMRIQARLCDEFGLVNCWHHCNPDLPLAQTLRWTNDPTAPYHCDGVFVPAHWAERLSGCTVMTGGRWTELSDHHPVLAEFA